MPVQKGKKNRRPRGGRGGPVYSETNPVTPTRGRTQRSASGATPVRRTWKAPLWLNLTVGPLMLAAGLWFGLLEPGAHTSSRLIMLVLYLAVGGWYLFQAFRQIRERQAQQDPPS